ncbi:hypothetical protein BJV74DRAFT_794541 [Russula compacta]|nr:hypothetical protein BJV74DRAFT_794541 [Russula compacta]
MAALICVGLMDIVAAILVHGRNTSLEAGLKLVAVAVRQIDSCNIIDNLQSYIERWRYSARGLGMVKKPIELGVIAALAKSSALRTSSPLTLKGLGIVPEEVFFQHHRE